MSILRHGNKNVLNYLTSLLTSRSINLYLGYTKFRFKSSRHSLSIIDVKFLYLILNTFAFFRIFKYVSIF